MLPFSFIFTAVPVVNAKLPRAKNRKSGINSLHKAWRVLLMLRCESRTFKPFAGTTVNTFLSPVAPFWQLTYRLKMHTLCHETQSQRVTLQQVALHVLTDHRISVCYDYGQGELRLRSAIDLLHSSRNGPRRCHFFSCRSRTTSVDSFPNADDITKPSALSTSYKTN